METYATSALIFKRDRRKKTQPSLKNWTLNKSFNVEKDEIIACD